MNIEISTVANDLVIGITGRFDFGARDQFMAFIEGGLPQTPFNCIRVDLGAVEYVDSSALGMLLMLRDRAKNKPWGSQRVCP